MQHFRFVVHETRDPNAAAAQIAGLHFRSDGEDEINHRTLSALVSKGSSCPLNCGPESAIDGRETSKWRDEQKQPINVKLMFMRSIDEFCFSTAQDEPDCDPAKWSLEASADGLAWEEVIVQSDADFTTLDRGARTPWCMLMGPRQKGSSSPRRRCLVTDVGNVTNPNSGQASEVKAMLNGSVEAEKVETAVAAQWKLAKDDSSITKEAYWTGIRDALDFDQSLIPELDAKICSKLRTTFMDTLAVLEKAKASGVVLGVISNHTKFWFEECASACRFDKLMDQELCINSSEVFCSKPKARIFEIFLERLASAHPGMGAADCIFVDDKKKNLTAAEALGFQVVLHDATQASPGDLEQKLAALGLVLS